MANISLTNKYVNQRYYGSGYGSSSGITSRLAQKNAYNAGQSASLNWGTPSTQTGNSYVGKLENRTVETGTPEYVSELNQYSCTYNVTATAYLYQVHLEFDISGLNSSNVESATLTINSSGTSIVGYYICAPNSNSSNINDSTYYAYDNSVFSATRVSFEQNTTSKSIDITSQLKQCINTNKGIIVITPAAKTPGYSSQLSGLSYTLSYTEAVTPCGAPTSISDNGTGYIVPNGDIRLKWSGATAGNNNDIAGYQIYWKQDGAPTTSSYTGYYNTNNTATSCTFSSATSGSMPTTRGKTYYFKILTIGKKKLNSSLSSTQTSLKVNQLPAIPIVSVNYDRFKSTGGSVVFTVNPGADGDSGQTKNVYYSTSLSGTKAKITGSTFTTDNLTNNTTFYFWTYDGYEYSTNNFSKEIKKNTAPELGTVTLSINSSTTLFNNFNIDGSCTSETCDTNGRIVSRRWELYLNGGETIIVPNANTLSGFSNFNIVNNSHITFGQIYRIRYIITDDIGETATKVSTARTFPTPNISLYNKKDTEITSNFGKEIYLKYNQIGNYTAPYNFNGVEFYYKLSSSSNWIKLRNLNTTISNLNNKEKIDCSALNSGSTYNLKIKYILSNGSSTEIDLGTKTRSIALNPVVTASGICYPFQVPSGGTNTNSFTFTYQDNGSSYETKTFNCYIGTEIVSSDYYILTFSNLQGTISLKLSDIPTSAWQSYIGDNNTLNDSYLKDLKIEIVDEFGDSYIDTKNWTFDFSNSLLSGASASVQIKATDDNYYDFSNNYPLFESQILKVEISDLKSYCNETVTLVLTDNTGVKYSTSTLNLSVSGGTSNRPEYISNNANFTFVMPKIITNNKNNSYFILEIENGSKQQILYVNIKENEKFIISRCNTDAIDLQIIKVEKNGNNYNFTCQITDFGGYGLAPYKDKYSEIKLNIYYSNSYGDSYSNFASNIDITNSSIVDNIFTINNISSMVTLSGERVYFKPEIIVTNNFQKINNIVPFGMASHTKSYNDTTYYIFYSSVPNLAYGKNFFLINTTGVGGHNDQVLIIRPISNQKVIYFGETGNEATITMNNNNIILDNFIINGVIADGATIECGTWDQS